MDPVNGSVLGAVADAPVLGLPAPAVAVIAPPPVVADTYTAPIFPPQGETENPAPLAISTETQPAPAPAEKPARKRKQVEKQVKRGRGRPAVFVGKLAKYIASLIRKHGATNTRKILAARKGSKLADHRDSTIIAKPVKISMPTLLAIAKKHKVKLHRGRPKVKKVATVKKAA